VPGEIVDISAAPGTPAKKKKSGKKKNQPGKYSMLVIDIIRKLAERNGSSLVKIYNEAKKVSWFDQQNGRTYLRYSIKALLLNDSLIQVKGTGANGSFKINKKKFEKSGDKKSASKSPKAPAAARKAKKPSEKKAKAKASPKKKKKPDAPAGAPKKAAVKPKKAAKKPTAAKKVKPKKVTKPSVPKVPKAKKAPKESK
uniref:H1.10 linker histone n=1 Tax=Paramormyrops kingsleyae TaxID=1676925 RepID=A0A3B3QZ20_9TELE